MSMKLPAESTTVQHASVINVLHTDMTGKSIEETAVSAASGFGSAISVSKRRLTFTCCDWNNNRFSVHTYCLPRAPNLAPLASGLSSAHALDTASRVLT